MKAFAIAVLAISLSGCAQRAPLLPEGPAAYAVVPAADVTEPTDYKIGPLDVMKITVFQEPELSPPETVVDSSGTIQFPLVGAVRAGGLTAPELASVLQQRLGERYLVNPQVTVTITTSASRRLTVEGAVTQPGVYEMQGRMSLVDAIALAKGPNQTARFDRVAIFRRVNGERVGGLFDLSDIRRGAAADPEVLPGDQIVVANSFNKELFRGVLQSAPLLAVIFRPF